jgi:hypothetical protein
MAMAQVNGDEFLRQQNTGPGWTSPGLAWTFSMRLPALRGKSPELSVSSFALFSIT